MPSERRHSDRKYRGIYSTHERIKRMESRSSRLHPPSNSNAGNTREDDAARKNKVIGAKPKIPILKVMLSSRKGPGICISDY
ncbi:hypothetical protein BDQ17DRAFT_1362028 [Cyathus striatus]|nr:hypothetical protein BDQ17DRAFT_1362028 [Cyathus striatus]